MKHLFVFVLFAAILVSCAPGVRYTPEDGGRFFTMTSNGNGSIVKVDSSWLYSTNEYEITFSLYQDSVHAEIVNLGDDVMRVLYDSSAYVLPDGSSSRVVTGNVTWDSRTSPQTPAVIPPNAKQSDLLVPFENLFFSGGIRSVNIFDYPLKSRTSFSLFLTMEVAGESTAVTFVWEGNPDK